MKNWILVICALITGALMLAAKPIVVENPAPSFAPGSSGYETNYVLVSSGQITVTTNRTSDTVTWTIGGSPVDGDDLGDHTQDFDLDSNGQSITNADWLQGASSRVDFAEVNLRLSFTPENSIGNPSAGTEILHRTNTFNRMLNEQLQVAYTGQTEIVYVFGPQTNPITGIVNNHSWITNVFDVHDPSSGGEAVILSATNILYYDALFFLNGIYVGKNLRWDTFP